MLRETHREGVTKSTARLCTTKSFPERTHFDSEEGRSVPPKRRYPPTDLYSVTAVIGYCYEIFKTYGV